MNEDCYYYIGLSSMDLDPHHLTKSYEFVRRSLTLSIRCVLSTLRLGDDVVKFLKVRVVVLVSAGHRAQCVLALVVAFDLGLVSTFILGMVLLLVFLASQPVVKGCSIKATGQPDGVFIEMKFVAATFFVLESSHDVLDHFSIAVEYVRMEGTKLPILADQLKNGVIIKLWTIGHCQDIAHSWCWRGIGMVC